MFIIPKSKLVILITSLGIGTLSSLFAQYYYQTPQPYANYQTPQAYSNPKQINPSQSYTNQAYQPNSRYDNRKNNDQTSQNPQTSSTNQYQNARPNPTDPNYQNNNNNGIIAQRDRDDDRSLYNRNARRLSWDYRDNWRYDREAFLRGNIRPYNVQSDEYQEEYRYYLPRGQNYRSDQRGYQYPYQRSDQGYNYYNRPY